MKILALRGSNIASLTEFVVEFQAEPLRSAGIFAITGPTGSGKSSLLDAMCLALYQKAPRLDDLSGRETRMESRFGTIGQSDIRNLLRRGCDTGHAECDFLASDGSTYRAHWGYRAAKRAGASVQEEMSLVRLDDNKVLIQGMAGKKSEFKEAIETLVGLTYNQFTRTVLLAQGRFAEFLRSNEDDRADLLEKLTGTAIFSRISARIFERTNLVRRERDELERARQALAVLDPQEREARVLELMTRRSELPRLQDGLTRIRQFIEGLDRLDELERSLIGNRNRLDTLLPLMEAGKARIEAARADVARSDAAKSDAAPLLNAARTLDSQLETARSILEDRQARLLENTRRLKEIESRNRSHAAKRDALQKDIESDTTWLEARKAKLEPLANDWSLWQDRLRQADVLHREMVRRTAQVAQTRSELDQAQEECQGLRQELSDISLPPEASSQGLLQEISGVRSHLAALADLPPWLELQSEIVESESLHQELSARNALVQGAVVTNQVAWELAKRLLDSVTTALSGDVLHLRSCLEPRSPCPVCGSQEHPWSLQSPALESLHSRHRLEETAARQRLDETRQEHQSLVARLQALDESIHRAKERRSRLDPSSEWVAKAIAQDAPLPWARGRIADLKSREAALLDQLKLLESRDALLAKLRTREADLDGRAKALDKDRTELERVQVQLEQGLEALDVPFGSADWRAKWRENPGFTEQLTKSVTEFLDRKEALDRNRRDFDSSTAELAAYQNEFETKRKETAEQEASLEAARTELTQLQSERSSLLGGRSVQEFESRLDGEITDSRKRLETAQADASTLEQDKNHLEGQLAAQITRRQLEDSQLETLAASIFDTAPEGPGPDRRPVALEMSVQHDAALSEHRTRIAQLEMELSVDAANRKQSEAMIKQLSETNLRLESWSLLNQEIGSADGKLFRRIAMQYTLEILLEEANGQLESIAPRYSLQRLGSSMHFGVLDHESYEELRPVQTLSGGESFLVSLALALGLSHMAGGDLSVESLFIDEGFGTLDGETLQGVMAALSGLHAQGRKVGLITHVEEMKEQIPAQVRVIKLGQGASRIEIIG